MAILNRPSTLARPNLIITEYRSLIHYMEMDIRKLQEKFHRDPTVASKVMALSNRPSSLARPDLIITEYRFLIHSMEKGIRKLQ
jgi:HD-like signal output (HDOD) protein